MRLLFATWLLFALVGTAAAAELPDEPPEDFFISYKLTGLEGGVPDFRFTANASGNATFKVEGDKKVQFAIGTKVVQKLYRAARKSKIFKSEASATAGNLEIRVVANGHEQTVSAIHGDCVWPAITNAVVAVLDAKVTKEVTDTPSANQVRGWWNDMLCDG